MKKLVFMLFLAACATPAQKPQLTAPDWTAVPPGVLDALCGRLQIDAIASGAPLAIISTTRPLATQQSLNALALMGKGRVSGELVTRSVAEMNRELTVTTEGATCNWRAVAAAQLAAHRDELMVEVSAPAINPFAPKSGGMLARASVGGEGASWYWITLVPRNGRWSVGPVYVLVQ